MLEIGGTKGKTQENSRENTDNGAKKKKITVREAVKWGSTTAEG